MSRLVDASVLSLDFQERRINRITRRLWDEWEPLAWAGGDDNPNPLTWLRDAIKEKLRFARGESGNSGEGGDLYVLPPNLWLVRNETGGWTLMHAAEGPASRSEAASRREAATRAPSSPPQPHEGED